MYKNAYNIIPNSQNEDDPNAPSTGEWLNKMGHSHTMEYPLGNKNEWTVNTQEQYAMKKGPQRTTYCMIPFI